MMERKIKVVQVIADSELGGGPKHVLGLLNHLDQQKFEPYLVCQPGWLSKEAKEIKGVGVFNVRFKSKFDLASWFVLRRTIEKIQGQNDPFGPIIIHVHGSRASLATRMFKAPGVRYVYTEHIFDFNYHLENRLNEWIQRRLLKIMNHKTDAIIAVSTSVRKFLVQSRLAPENRIVVVPNGIEINQTAKIKHQNDKSKMQKEVIIGTVGSLNKLKGQGYLIEAFAEIAKKHPLAILEIIGEGPEKSNLQFMAGNLGIKKNVALLGQVQNTSKRMKDWNVFVLPSLAESFGIVILEAMAVGLPVVASEVGGIPDIIKNNIEGVLVKPQDAKGLVRAIEKILSDHDFAKKLAVNAQNRAEDFAWPVIIKKIENVYLKLV